MKERKVAGATSYDCASTSLRSLPNLARTPTSPRNAQVAEASSPERRQPAADSTIAQYFFLGGAWRWTAPATSTSPTDNHSIRKVIAAGVATMLTGTAGVLGSRDCSAPASTQCTP